MEGARSEGWIQEVIKRGPEPRNLGMEDPQLSPGAKPYVGSLKDEVPMQKLKENVKLVYTCLCLPVEI